MLETWKSWRDGTYEVSDLGNVRRAKPGISTFVGRPVKPIMSAGGYAQVALKSENKTFRVYIHQAVIESFVGIRPPGTVVNHKDSDKSNNALVNLEYITHRENCEHSLREGTRKRGPSMPPRPKKGKQTGEAHWTHRTPERIARQDGGRDRAGHRHQVRQARHAQTYTHAPQTLLAQVPEPLPIAREVTGQENDDQNLNGFDRLKGSQVDLLVAGAGPAAEAQQQGEQHKCGQQRRVDPIREPPVIERAHERQQQQQAAQKNAQRELAEFERVAQRVAQAHHQDQADAGEQVQRRQDGGVARKPARAPGEPDQVKAAQVHSRPDKVLGPELVGRAHHQQGLELRYGQQRLALLAQPRERAHVAQRMGRAQESEQLFGIGLALRAVLDDVEKRRELLCARHGIEIQQIGMPQPLGNIGEVLRFSGVYEGKTGGDQE